MSSLSCGSHLFCSIQSLQTASQWRYHTERGQVHRLFFTSLEIYRRWVWYAFLVVIWCLSPFSLFWAFCEGLVTCRWSISRLPHVPFPLQSGLCPALFTVIYIWGQFHATKDLFLLPLIPEAPLIGISFTSLMINQAYILSSFCDLWKIMHLGV